MQYKPLENIREAVAIIQSSIRFWSFRVIQVALSRYWNTMIRNL